ncbi:MAG: NADP-dependent oxidoreductase [Verrucomicrobiota bacterium]|nr:NADP-dependent oxidoreductase [Verrucomicrobiota bacterium]
MSTFPIFLRQLLRTTAFSTALPLLALAQENAEPAASSEEEVMKAVRMHAYGGLEVLQFEDAPRPQPNDDQILIRIIAAGVNPVDAKIRQGMFARMMGTKLPVIPGLDVSGIVEEAGANVTKFKPGDAVYACLGFGTQGGYAEYAVAKESEASPKPKGLSHEGAAAMPVAAATAWQALIEIANVSQGQTVLIHGGSGGVGVFAIQIAKARGAKVIATASAANQEFMRELGADRTIDYNATKFEEVAKDVDMVLDSVGGETLERSYGVVKKGGIIVSLVEPPDKAELDARGIRGTAFMVSPNASLLSDLSKLVEAKKLKPVVSKTFPLSEAAKAQEAIETGHTRGKIVLRVADEPKG